MWLRAFDAMDARGAQRGQWDTDPNGHASGVAVNNDSLSAGKCIDVYVDWSVVPHYDYRVVRNCEPYGYRQSDQHGDGWYIEPDTSASLRGFLKGAGCIYITSSRTFQQCTQFSANQADCAVWPGDVEQSNVGWKQTWRLDRGPQQCVRKQPRLEL